MHKAYDFGHNLLLIDNLLIALLIKLVKIYFAKPETAYIFKISAVMHGYVLMLTNTFITD